MKKIVGVVSTVLLGTTLAVAETIELSPAKDNTLYEDEEGRFSNGAGEHLFTGKTAKGSRRRGLIAFDVATVLPPEPQYRASKSPCTCRRASPERRTSTCGGCWLTGVKEIQMLLLRKDPEPRRRLMTPTGRMLLPMVTPGQARVGSSSRQPAVFRLLAMSVSTRGSQTPSWCPTFSNGWTIRRKTSAG